MTIERALIADKVDKYRYKVRIPSLNKSEAAVGSTPNSELYTACVSSTPGIVPAYNIGNAVYVGFEASDCSEPVILGALLNDNACTIQSDINATSLTVKIDTHLSKDTYIGKVTPDNIATLEGQTIRIKNEFERVDAVSQALGEHIKEINNTIIYMQEHDDKADADAARLAQRTTQAEADIVTNATTLSSHTSNGTIHIVSSERTNWNSAVTHSKNGSVHVTNTDKTNWNTHLAETGIHVTETQKTKWNNHVNNTTVHITATERSNWNNKAAGNHTHTSFGTMVLTSGVTYGDSLPASASSTKGQLFFLLESE